MTRPGEPTSPAAWLLGHAERTPDAPALDAPGVRLTYAALAERVAALAGSLSGRGVGPADRVIVALPFGPAAAVATLAVQTLGACAVEIDRGMGAAGAEAVIAQAAPRFAIVHAADAATWAGAIASAAGTDLSWAWTLQGPAPAVPARGRTVLKADGALAQDEGATPVARAATVASDQPALVVFTSGSTGKPRGVIQTYGNVDANSRSIVEYLRLGPHDRALALLPLHYCYGKSVLQTHLLAGGSVFIEPRFMYPRVAMASLAAERCTGFAGVPATFEILRREVDLSGIDRSWLRYLTQAGGRMRPETIRWARQAFAPAELFVMYGQTEATARLSYLPPARAAEKEGSIGIAIPGVVLAVVDEQARPVPEGEVGHLVARGRNVTPGYLGAPEDTAAILHDGWLWTGDLAFRDAEGFFFLVGRAKEILKVGGYRVSPLELEEALCAHPAVAEAAVVGAPDPLQGEIAIGFVVLRPGAEASEDSLRRACRERLASYKVPSRVVAIAAIPKSSAGKPLKAQLRDHACEVAASQLSGGTS